MWELRGQTMLDPVTEQAPQGAYAEVYQLLDAAANISGRAVPPGTQGALSWAIDSLRREKAPPAIIRRIEAVSLAIHRLQWALRDRGVEAEARAAACRDEIAALRAEWLETTPLPQ